MIPLPGWGSSTRTLVRPIYFTISVNLQYVIVPAKQRGFAVMRKKVRVDVDSDERTADLEVR